MKKFICIILSILCLFSLGACDKGNNKPSAKSYALLSFESVDELLSFYRISIAKTELNTDKNYITHGNSSMKISYYYDVGENEYAKDMVLGFVPGTDFFKKESAADVGYYAIDVYNPNGRECEVGVNVAGATIDEYTLKEGWNTVYTYVDRTAIYYVRGETLGYYSITFRGEKGVNSEFYVDNFRYYETKTAYEKFVFDNSLTDTKAWHEFSSTAETKMFEYSGVKESQFSQPRFTINTDNKYVLTGNSSLKVSFYNKKNGKIDLTNFKTIDGSMPDFTPYTNGEGWYIYSNIFNAYDNEITVTYTLVSTNSTGAQEYKLKIKIPANSWSNVQDARLYLDDIKEDFGGVVDILHLKYSVSGIQSEGSIYIDSLGIAKD